MVFGFKNAVTKNFGVKLHGYPIVPPTLLVQPPYSAQNLTVAFRTAQELNLCTILDCLLASPEQ